MVKISPWINCPISNSENLEAIEAFDDQNIFEQKSRTVDEFDFDEDEFLAALEENQPIGTTEKLQKVQLLPLKVMVFT